MFRAFSVVVFFATTAVAQSPETELESNRWLSDERGALAAPNSAAMNIGFINGLRAKLGAPLPIYRGPHGGASIRAFVELHEDQPIGNKFPFSYWRGFVSFGGHLQWRSPTWTNRLQLAFEHESDHQSAAARLTEFQFIYTNSMALWWDSERTFGEVSLFTRVGGYYHLVSCTDVSRTPVCPQAFTPDSHGPELRFDVAANGPMRKLEWSAALHAGWTPARGDIIEERRVLVEAGIGWNAFGTWRALLQLWVGNAVGQRREVRNEWVGFALRYVPWRNASGR